MKKIFSFLLMVFTASVGLLAVTTQNVYATSSLMTVYDTENEVTLGTASNQIEVHAFYFASEGQLSLDSGAPIDVKGSLIEISVNAQTYVYLPEDDITLGVATNSIVLNIGYYASEAQISLDGGAPIDIKGYYVKLLFAPNDTTRPTISGEENFATSVNDLRPLSFFQGFLYAYDETDGDITDSIVVVTDNYTANMSTLGRYEVTFAVEDSAGNLTELVAYINVVDITAPVISGNTNVAEVSYTQTYNISTFRSTLTITDNYHNLTNSNIVVETDNYTSNKTVPGTYSIVFSATDPSGNKTTFTKQVKVIDDIAPVFSGTTLITKPSNSILTVANIQSQLSAVDAIEGNKTAQITVQSDGFTGNGNRVGSYDIVFQVQDSKGNKSTHTVRVNVVDNIAPIIYIKDNVSIVLKANEVLTREQIIQILQVTEQIQSVNQTTVFSFDIDEYSGNENTVGLYMMSVRVSNVSGNESVHNMMINVVEGDSEDDITVEEPHYEWYEHVWNFFVATFNFIVNIFVSIWNFFVGIWNWVVGLFQASEEVAFAYFVRRY
ncbi:Uncharacterised protein [Acholeplasma oculi]|uniref:Phage envelope protein of Acholeplasma phage L2 n=1 Tax=Acholeplasma oculi TaxID=35623 RepID=A0A061AA02_9MOLU|nr:hypothetical protein [Acholeplasma oculi]CDR30199.1 Phage envelope protein of Acholeplasma phage L2 [Acholeplasma oculi]SUT88563.1 Uncharacterised protein [Acholeplasma oculi]